MINKYFLYFLFLSIFLFIDSSIAAIHYISKNGYDSPKCTDGTRDRPWATWRGNNKKKCIKPGDTVFFMPGTYETNMLIFDGPKSNTIKVDGTVEKPIIISVDPEINPKIKWPVKFKGSMIISGSYLIIEKIEFNGNGGQPLTSEASHLTIKNNLIHGQIIDVDFEKPSMPYDCLKILAIGPQWINGERKIVRNQNINVLKNTISDCPGDAIDSTGAKNLIYRNNNIYNCGGIQVKGGTENILIESNRIHQMKNGIYGSDMGDPMGYVGNPELQNVKIIERFVANNITIRNNLVYDIYRGKGGYVTIGVFGWKNVYIYHNTFYNLGNMGIIIGSSGFDFYDDFAIKFCDANPDKCGPCWYRGGKCKNIQFNSKNIYIKNNIISYQKNMMKVNKEIKSLNNIDLENNLYYNNGNDFYFRIGDKKYTLKTFIFEKNSFEKIPGFEDFRIKKFNLKANSFSINKGVNLNVDRDYLNNLRDNMPDIGAYEYK